MKTCPKCYASFDLDSLPVSEMITRQTATIPSGKQCDILCPRCGTLLSRTINGVSIDKDHKDERAEKFAAKCVAAAAKQASKKSPKKSSKKSSKKRKSASKK